MPHRYSTRTQTGAIRRRNYAFNLRLVGDALPFNRPNRPPAERLDPKLVKEWKKAVEREAAEQKRAGDQWDSRTDPTGGYEWWPKEAQGRYEEHGKSKIQWADQKIQDFENWRKKHIENNMPESAIKVLDGVIKSAREERARLDDEPGADKIGDEDFHEKAISDRIATLQRALDEAIEKNHVREEIDNMQEAIRAYREGDIGYSTQYTLIYAGRIVDRADTYDEFAVDRMRRLDRYCEEFGPGWLWFEYPLDVHSDAKVRQMGDTALIRTPATHGLGHYFITQGFWKRSGWVRRIQTATALQGVRDLPPMESLLHIEQNGRYLAGDVGPRAAFRSLLDSGATYPTIYESDLAILGIDPAYYSCQGLTTCQTANGLIESRIYELYVEVVNEIGKSVPSRSDPAVPGQTYLGALTPVSIIKDPAAPGVMPDGQLENERLSGMLAFLACYMTTSPSRNIIFLGDNRNDVVGIDRMPPCRRWVLGMDQTVHPHITNMWGRFGNPLITFRHLNGQVVDEDLTERRSQVTMYGPNPTTIITDPHNDPRYHHQPNFTTSTDGQYNTGAKQTTTF